MGLRNGLHDITCVVYPILCFLWLSCRLSPRQNYKHRSRDLHIYTCMGFHGGYEGRVHVSHADMRPGARTCLSTCTYVCARPPGQHVGLKLPHTHIITWQWTICCAVDR